jgi:hypothetical protein
MVVLKAYANFVLKKVAVVSIKKLVVLNLIIKVDQVKKKISQTHQKIPKLKMTLNLMRIKNGAKRTKINLAS